MCVKKEKKKTMGLTGQKYISYAAVGLAKNFWQGAMADSAIN